MKSTWTDDDVETLKRHYSLNSPKELAILLPHHSISAIKGKIERLGLRKGGRLIDYTDKIIGSLHILKRIPSKPIDLLRGSPTWLAKCKCGNSITITSYSIRKLNTPSCGCQRPISQTKGTPQDRTLNMYFKQYQDRAIRDNIKWQLTKEEFIGLIKQNCDYCGIQPSRITNAYYTAQYRPVKSLLSKKRHAEGAILVNGIDRVDSKKDYSLDNCVPCCKDCNYGKHTKTPEQFLQWINSVWQHQNKKETS